MISGSFNVDLNNKLPKLNFNSGPFGLLLEPKLT